MSAKRSTAKKWSLRIALGIVALVALALIAFILYAQFDYGPSEVLAEQVDLGAIKSDGHGLIFQPENPNGQGLILYQGAKVEAEAYAYLGGKLSEQGYTVSIPQLPLKFGIFGVNKAEAVIEDYPEITSWFIGGHSLGGVAAAMYAEEHQDELAGLFFLGSYPAGDFAASELPMLSLYGENDGLTLLEDIENNRALFSFNSEFIEVPGGNHAQFGLYGEQKGDNPASISPLDQQDFIVEALLNWMKDK
ncbi:pimeloyl-ACP methyl ester carboxylesterase [Planomicrobium sp. HSC-17F08]|nr:pimeloyl-ACP methyl ester carboxylesterase [Planomicrobium sp. HSC-17F08]